MILSFTAFLQLGLFAPGNESSNMTLKLSFLGTFDCCNFTSVEHFRVEANVLWNFHSWNIRFVEFSLLSL